MQSCSSDTVQNMIDDVQCRRRLIDVLARECLVCGHSCAGGYRIEMVMNADCFVYSTQDELDDSPAQH